MQGGVRARAGREAGGSKLARANYPNEFRGLGLLKVRLSPSNVAGEKTLHLPEGSKASFGGVFLQYLRLLSGSSAYLYVEVEKKNPRLCDDKKERGAAACWHLCWFCLLF